MSERSAGHAFSVPRDLWLPLAASLAVALPMWLILIFVFKSELNTYGDEVGYDLVARHVAGEIGGGTFVEYVLHDPQVKYIGYYSLLGAIYFVFGPYHMIARLIGCLSLVGSAIVLSNTVRLVAGRQATRAALIAMLFCPLFNSYGIDLLRDVYVLLGVTVIVYHMLATVVRGAPPVSYGDLLALFVAYVLLLLMRTPQALMMGLAHAMVLVLSLAWSHPKYRLFGIAISAGALIVLAPPLLRFAQRTVDRTVFESEQRMTLRLAGATITNVGSASDLVSGALQHPMQLPLEYAKKLTGHLLGPVPFTDTTDTTSSVFDEDFDPASVGGEQRIDVILTEALFWPFVTILAPFACFGAVELFREKPGVAIAITGLWFLYTTVVIVMQNDFRWGMPIYLLVLIVQMYGWARAKGQRAAFVASFLAGFGFLAGIRFIHIKLPMIILPVMWTFLLILIRRRHARSAELEYMKPARVV